MRSSDPFAALQADCGRCLALCCIGPALTASADFALDKPAGQPCVHLRADARCGIHDGLRERGFPGCAAYDCFGAGQHVVQVTFLGRSREPAMYAVLPVVRRLHELRWYLEEVLDRPAADPVHAEARELSNAVAARAAAGPDELLALDVAAHHDAVAPLLRRASALVRGTARENLAHRDLAGANLRDARLSGAELRGALLIGADLRGADLHTADLLGADLRAADLRGTDLTDALFLTRSQIGSAVGDAATRMPARLPRPAHWR
jgi:hypothetical protein